MNLNNIKGIVEIDGVKFNPKDILQALVEQGLKVHFLNGTLLIGRSFVDSSPNLENNEKSCPMAIHCKIYDRLNNSALCENEIKTLKTEFNSAFDSLDVFPSNFQPETNRNYVDRVQINNNDIDITDLFSSSSETSSSYKPFPFNENISDEEFNINEVPQYKSRPTEMIGMSPPTKYGSSKINPTSIPSRYRGKCPYCGTTISINWKYCGNCGRNL